MHTNEANLTLATLIYATSCLEKGDWASLRELNFGEAEAKALHELQLSEFLSIADRMHAHPLNIRLNRDHYWQLLHQLREEQAIEDLKSEMICREAPVDMMRQLFGMTDRQYTAMRRRFRRRRGAGRPAEPDIETADIIWAAWQHHVGHRPPRTAHDWLTLAREADVDLRTLWRFVRQNSDLAALPS